MTHGILPRLIATLCLAGEIVSTGQPASPVQRRPPSPADQRQRPGPWDNDVLVWRVDADGKAEPIAAFKRAGVPTITRLSDGRLLAAHQHFPFDSDADFDKVAVHFSSDEGRAWTEPRVIRLAGLPEGMRFPFDPTLVSLPDGRVRLYFTSLKGRRFEEHNPAIFSAISTNGVDYTVEPGVRFAIEGRPVIDCAVAFHKGVFHLYAPDNGVGGPAPRPGNGRPPGTDRPRDGVGYHATSSDGVTFTRVADVQMPRPRRWLGNAISDGESITFFGTGDGGLWFANSSDGQEWSEPRSIAGMFGADPGAVKLKDGGLVVLATGPPRPDTPSARQQRPGEPDGDRPAGTRVLHDLSYVTDGHERQKLDLYLPAAGTHRPVIIWVHGGAWRAGNKDRPPALRFLERGYAVASVNYRLSQHATFPAQIQDCKAAVRWLRANARDYGLDPQRFGAWGSSAGGHLVALLGTAGDVKEFDVGEHLDQSSRVQGVVDFFGPTDFLQMDAHRLPDGMIHDTPDSPESRLVGGHISQMTSEVARANPVSYVTQNDSPFLIVHGDQDPLVPYHQSELLERALKKSGVAVTMYTVAGGGHGGFRDTEVDRLVAEFFERRLGPVRSIEQ